MTADSSHSARQGATRPPGLIRFYRWLWRFWKERRFHTFVEVIQPAAQETLLDVGGYPFNWYHRGAAVHRVDVLNLELSGSIQVPPGAPTIRAIAGDARQLSMPDHAYDVVFSNSVIEHVGDWNDQVAFAREVMRVGKKLWIQTPAWECPIEPHFLGLAIHWFPSRWHVVLARWLSVRGWSSTTNDLTAIANTTRLLRRREMEELFPGCKIWVERMLWIFPKSYVAIRLSAPTNPN